MGIARSSAKIFVSNISVSIISFIGILYFARKLGPDTIGVYFLFVALLQLLGATTDFGFRNALEKRLSEGENTAEFIGTVVLIKILTLCIATGLTYAFRDRINAYLNAELALYLIAALLIYEFAHLYIKILFGEQRGDETAIISIGQNLVWLGFGLILIWRGFDTLGLVFALIAGLVTKLAWAAYKQTLSIGKPTRQAAHSLFKFAKYNVIAVFGRYFYNWIDILLIGVFLSTTTVGQYEIAWRIAGITILLSRAISLVILPEISNWYKNEELKSIRRAVTESLHWSIVLVVPAFVATVLLAEEILLVLYGPEYVPAWSALIVIIGGKIFQSIHIVLERALQGMNKPHLSAIANIIGMVANAGFNLILIYYFGIIGAAVATSIGYLLTAGMHLHYIRKFIRLKLPFKRFGWVFISSSCMGGAIWVLQQYITADSFILLTFFVVAGVALYGMVLIIYTPIRNDITQALKSISI